MCFNRTAVEIHHWSSCSLPACHNDGKNNTQKQGKSIHQTLCWGVICTKHAISVLQDWVSDLKLFESGAKVNPSNAKILNNLGMELKSAGHIPEAQYLYEVGEGREVGSLSWFHTRRGR